MNKMGKKIAYICGRVLFKIPQLIGIDKVVGNYMELKMFTNDFFNKFFQSV